FNIVVVKVKAITEVGIGAGLNAQPPSHNLLQCHELDQVVRQALECVIAPHDLHPFEAAISDLEQGTYVTRDVRGYRTAICVRKISCGVPDLEHYLAAIGVVHERFERTIQLIETSVVSKPKTVCTMVYWP